MDDIVDTILELLGDILEPEDKYDYSVRPGQKRRARAARSARRRFNWERHNKEQFGPENEWEAEPVKVERTAEERRRYLWTGVM